MNYSSISLPCTEIAHVCTSFSNIKISSVLNVQINVCTVKERWFSLVCPLKIKVGCMWPTIWVWWCMGSTLDPEKHKNEKTPIRSTYCFGKKTKNSSLDEINNILKKTKHFTFLFICSSNFYGVCFVIFKETKRAALVCFINTTVSKLVTSVSHWHADQYIQ